MIQLGVDLQTILSIATPTTIAALGAAWGGVKVALNGTRERVEKIEKKVDGISTDVAYLKGIHAAAEVRRKA